MLLLVSGGLGLLVEQAAGVRLAGVLVVPVGLAALVAIAQLTTYWGATARLTTPLVVLAALAGFAAGWRRLRGAGVDVPPTLAAVAVFAVLGAPVVLSGHATFAGYTVLGDTAIQFLAIDRLLEHGRDLAGLPPSSYQAALRSYIDSGYPMGSQVALGAVRPLSGQDVAWVYQPYLAFLVANLALALYAITTRLIARRWQRAAVAFLAAQPALVVGYALQGSIKELATAWVVALLVALVGPLFAARQPVRAVVPLAVAGAAGIAAIGPAVLPWLAPIALVGLVGTIRERISWRDVVSRAGVFAGVVAVLSIPTFAALRSYAKVTQHVITSGSELGNLLGPLNPLQAAGIWLSGDYRLVPATTIAGLDARALTWVLVGVALASATIGLAWALSRRAWLLLVYVGISLLACVYVMRIGSPWADGKALMIVSPAAALVALVGPVALVGTRTLETRVGAGVLGLAIAAGILGSTALAYHDVSLAPRDRLAELGRIGAREAGQGPALYTEFEEFGKHFLRAVDPTGVSEAFSPDVAAAARPGGNGVRFGYPVDLDDLNLGYVERFRTLVLRRSPVASRPPVNFRRVYVGRWYEVWRRDDAVSRPLAHLPLGRGLLPAERPRCADVAALARQAPRGAQLAAPERPAPPRFLPTKARRIPGGWHVDGGEPLALDVSGQGELLGTLTIPSAGRYTLWLGGSFARPVTVALDGRRVARFGDELSGRGEFAAAPGSLTLRAGRHAVRIFRGGGSLAPGNGNGASRRLGPLILGPAGSAQPRVVSVPVGAWRSLCSRSLDWVETLRR